MRIIGGRFRGTRLASVGAGDMAAHLRPTTDRTRESLFNLLTHGDYPALDGARVLDLFAGTGALGLEALSRGAVSVTFVENGAKALGVLQQNITRLQVEAETQQLRRDATKLGQNPNAPYDLVFLDPPYGKGLGERALAAAHTGGWIATGALVVWEEGNTMTPPDWLHLQDQRRYGDSWLHLCRATTPPV